MKRFFLEIAFDGTDYHGWQKQDNAITVQSEMEKAISTILREEISCVGCGRTDTGVHASSFYLHFDTINNTDNLVYKLNRFLPQSIAVKRIIPVEDEAHTRFDATERTYRYYLHVGKDPFLVNYSWEFPHELDLEKMNDAGKILLKVDDFASFCKAHSDNKTTICDVRKAEWERIGNQLIFTITADRFLRNMVRAVVGSILEVGQGKKSINEFKEVVSSKNRSEAGSSVPAKGLFLEEIKYAYL